MLRATSRVRSHILHARWNLHRQIHRAGDWHQTSGTTWSDRYPEIFSCVGAELADQYRPKVLSFGCSTGEELLALRQVLPDATIVGSEINAVSRAAAERRIAGDKATVVTGSDWTELERLGPFDSVLAMSVLCRWPEPVLRSFSKKYPFQAWASAVSCLSSVVKKGGLLVLANSSYMFEEHPLYSEYEPVQHTWSSSLEIVLQHRRNGTRVLPGNTSSSVVFRKTA